MNIIHPEVGNFLLILIRLLLYKSYITLSFASIGRVLSFVWPWWFSSSLRQHLLREAQSPWWRTGEFWFTQFPWHNLLHYRGGSKGSGSRGSGRSNHPSGEDGDSGVGGSGIRTDKPPCVGLCYYNKLHGIPIETTTPRYGFKEQLWFKSFLNCFENSVAGSHVSASVTSTSYASPKGCLALSGEGDEDIFVWKIQLILASYYDSCYIINCIYCDLIYRSSSNMSCLCSFYLLDILSLEINC